jgi:hypothetical protein
MKTYNAFRSRGYAFGFAALMTLSGGAASTARAQSAPALPESPPEPAPGNEAAPVPGTELAPPPAPAVGAPPASNTSPADAEAEAAAAAALADVGTSAQTEA